MLKTIKLMEFLRKIKFVGSTYNCLLFLLMKKSMVFLKTKEMIHAATSVPAARNP